MPQELNKAIDEFKSPPNKALMRSYIIAIVFLSGVIAKMSLGNSSNNERELRECKSERNFYKGKFDSIIIAHRVEDLADKREMRILLAKQDSIKNNLERAIEKLIQKR